MNERTEHKTRPGTDGGTFPAVTSAGVTDEASRERSKAGAGDTLIREKLRM
jgi:hypothetical protein